MFLTMISLLELSTPLRREKSSQVYTGILALDCHWEETKRGSTSNENCPLESGRSLDIGGYTHIGLPARDNSCIRPWLIHSAYETLVGTRRPYHFDVFA